MENLASICRTCLSHSGNIVSVFKMEKINNEILPLSEMIFLCTDLEINDEEKISKNICSRCHLDVLQAFSFRKRSQDADKVLRHKLEQINENLRLLNNLEFQTPKETHNNDHTDEHLKNHNRDDVAATGSHVEDRLKFDVVYPESIEIKEEYDEDAKNESRSNEIESMDNDPMPTDSPTVLNDFYSTNSATVNDYHQEENKLWRTAYETEKKNKRDESDEISKPSYECDICHKSFEYMSKLEAHKAVHTDDRPYPCGICGQKFRLPYHRKRHYVIHTGVKAFKCDICFKRFSRKDHLKLHHTTHFDRTTIKEVKPYKCNFCDRTFGKRHHLTRHEIIHQKQPMTTATDFY